jgi:hypothetical protein
VQKSTLVGGFVAVVLVALASFLFARPRTAERAAATVEPTPSSPAPKGVPAPAEVHPGFLYGKVTTLTGSTYEGRLRWGGDQEAFWGDYFNGRRKENSWAALVPAGRLPKKRSTIFVFGIEIGQRERDADLSRLFMARMGDLARVEARGKDVLVTLKSGTVFELARFQASDFDDGVRVWPLVGEPVDLDSSLVRSVELLPAGPANGVPSRLHGTVRSRRGEFAGYVQWNRTGCVGTDELRGRSESGMVRLRFDTIRSIAKGADGGAVVTLADGGQRTLGGTSETGNGNRGLYVDDPRYGRVLVSWDAFERLDFTAADSGPGYGEFPPGGPLAGTVTTRAGRRLAGRLVYDLDESEVTETLDAPAGGIDYTIPLGLVAAVEPAGPEESGAPRSRVTLRSGEELRLEREGDLGEGNAGLLVFVDGRTQPEYVPWTEVARVDLDPPAAFYPPSGGREVPPNPAAP